MPDVAATPSSFAPGPVSPLLRGVLKDCPSQAASRSRGMCSRARVLCVLPRRLNPPLLLSRVRADLHISVLGHGPERPGCTYRC